MEVFSDVKSALRSNVFTDKELRQVKTLIEIEKDMNLNEQIQLAGLVYYMLYFSKASLRDIKENYPEDIVSIVSVLDKLDNLNYAQQDVEAENLRKMFFAITKDIRIIMLKIALVVTDIRNIGGLEEKKKRELANSVLLLFAPLAARLGLSKYKAELENSAFYILQPDVYNKIQGDVDARFHKRQPIVDRLVQLTQSCMDDLGIKGKVYGRKKHIYSIYKKLEGHDLDHIYDLIAVRAIVSSVADCYALYGRLSTKVEPMPKRFKDYIATPKPNGYQSLHTTVIFEGFPVEIQIRTEEMHKYAEYGIAAHWMYKEKRTKQDSLDVQLAWLRQMIDDDNNTSIDDLASSLNQDIYNSEIFVQTPMGKVIYLPNKATPIDFAYLIHSEIGNKCVGAKVNGKIVPVDSALNNGDVVEIITNPNSKGPSWDWLKICKTSEARSKINAFFKKNVREETIHLGKSMLENAIKEKGYSVNKLLTKQAIEDLLSFYNLGTINEFYANIGNNAISAKYITNKLVSVFKEQQKSEEAQTARSAVNLIEPTDSMVSVKDLDNTIVKFAGCCKPMIGDEIIGFISTGRGVIIHRKHCPNVSYFSKERLIDATWKKVKEKEVKKKK